MCACKQTVYSGHACAQNSLPSLAVQGTVISMGASPVTKRRRKDWMLEYVGLS